MLDETHDPARRTWVPEADGHADFPIQNLPLGVFAPPGGAPRGGIAIGAWILDLAALHASSLLDGEGEAACGAAAAPTLNAFLGLGMEARVALRRAVGAVLDARAKPRPELLHRGAECRLVLPARVGGYTDFYAGIHHATNVGRLFRPDSPLMPNYKYVPIGYHGRTSSLIPSGTAIRRPNGQRKRPVEAEPSFGPSRNLDYELELGIWIGTGNALGSPVPIAEAGTHIAGFCLLNDWSARDIQGWEYQPLGPFLAKNFATSISPWIVTPEALAPFRVPQPARPAGDPAPLPHLFDAADQQAGALDLTLEVLLLTPHMRAGGMAPHRLSGASAQNLYWTPAQLLAHHTCGGCNLEPGDLLGSGTISGPTPDGYGSLLEITNGGRAPITLPSGEERRFLEDGDEVILRAWAARDGFARIGLGECRGAVLPAP